MVEEMKTECNQLHEFQKWTCDVRMSRAKGSSIRHHFRQGDVKDTQLLGNIYSDLFIFYFADGLRD